MFKFEKITKIGAALLQHSFSLRFVAIVIRAGIIERTVKTAMQISSAGWALRLPADKKILCDFFFTFVADVHIGKNTGNTE